MTILGNILRGGQRGVVVPKIAPISTRMYGYRSSYPGLASTGAMTANTLYGIPFYVPGSVTANRIECNITTAGAAGKLLRLGLYDADPATGLPRTLLADSGALAADPGVVPTIAGATLNPTIALAPGLTYFLALVSDGAPTLTSTTGYQSLFGNTDASELHRCLVFRAFSYAALPTPWGTPSGYSQAAFNVVVKAA